MSAQPLNDLSSDPGLSPDSKVFGVSPYLIVPQATGQFSLFLRQGDKLVLYARRGEQFSLAHRDRLSAMGVDKVYVSVEERDGYDGYVRQHLGDILGDETIPAVQRCQVWHDTSVNLVRDLFDFSVPGSEIRNRYNRVRQLLKSSMRFISDPGMLRELSRFLQRGFEPYEHSLGVMVLTATTLGTWSNMDGKLMLAVTAGALLHDIGLSRLPKSLEERAPEDLTGPEWTLLRTHPSLGVSICSRLPIAQETLQCILFHHQREDGQGYPSGALGGDIPFYPKVVALANTFDNLSRDKPWRKGLSPFEALKAIKGDRGLYDSEVLKRLILVLSKAQLA